MMRRLRAASCGVLLAGCILLAAAPSCANDDISQWLNLFPDAQMPLRPDGAARTIAFGKTETIEIQPLRFRPLPDRSAALNTTWCGVVLRNAGGAAQGLVTVGTGTTEALSCGHLLEAGALSGSGATVRMGLIYRASSPNVTVIMPIVVTRPGRDAPWRVDTDLTERLARLPGTASLAWMRQALRHP